VKALDARQNVANIMRFAVSHSTAQCLQHLYACVMVDRILTLTLYCLAGLAVASFLVAVTRFI